MSIPEGRCGFVVEDPTGESDHSDDWYRYSSAVCCWRESWEESGTERCVWHAEVEEKTPGDLPAYYDRFPRDPERLEGSFLRGATLRYANLSNASLFLADFGGADLRNADLSGANLARADLSGADLRKVDFREADLSGATLRYADLSDAILLLADLSGADLREADLSGADFLYSDLSGADLVGAKLPNVTLRGADLSGAVLEDAELEGADLSDADLSGVFLSYTHLANATLRHADLSDAVLLLADLSGADLSFADLSDAYLREADLSDANFVGVDLSDGDLKGVDLSDAYLRDTDLSGADLYRANLAGANLAGADLSHANFRETDLSDKDLREADLSGADLSGADLSNSNLEEVDLSGADLRNADLSDAKLLRARLWNVDLWWADLSLANFREADLSGAYLRNADLTDANFESAGLSWADLTSITFSDGSPPDFSLVGDTERTILDSVDFSGLDLRDHDFPGARFHQTDFSGADLYKTNLERTDVNEAIFDEADCRQARFEYANMERASLIECDLRSADLHGVNLYQAALTDCRMNLSTTVSDVFAYPPLEVEERCVRSLWSHTIRKARRAFGARSVEPLETDRTFALHTFGGNPVQERAPWRGRVDMADWLERRAWTRQTIHRQLIVHGRVRQAVREKHYLDEQYARLQRARLELWRSWGALVGNTLSGWIGTRVAGVKEPGAEVNDGEVSDSVPRNPSENPLSNRGYRSRLSAILWAIWTVQSLKTTNRLVRMSEYPLYVGKIILLVTGLFAFGLYPSVTAAAEFGIDLFAGMFTRVGTGWGGWLFSPPVLDAWQLFLFSLTTFLEGTYLVLKGTLDTFLHIEEFEPAGVSVAIVSGLEPSGLAASLAWLERLLGALLVVPFALLVVQRLRLYIGTAVNEEGLGGGLLSWLLGK